MFTNKGGKQTEAAIDTPIWTEFCDLRSYNYYWHPEAEKNNFPPVISIREFSNGEPTPFVKGYFKFFGEEKVKPENKYFYSFMESL